MISVKLLHLTLPSQMVAHSYARLETGLLRLKTLEVAPWFHDKKLKLQGFQFARRGTLAARRTNTRHETPIRVSSLDLR
jgi:hypothetical protein